MSSTDPGKCPLIFKRELDSTEMTSPTSMWTYSGSNLRNFSPHAGSHYLAPFGAQHEVSTAFFGAMDSAAKASRFDEARTLSGFYQGSYATTNEPCKMDWELFMKTSTFSQQESHTGACGLQSKRSFMCINCQKVGY